MTSGLIEQIEREIAATRMALDRTIRALQFELSPRHQMEEALRSAKVRTQRSLRASANWAVANPVPIAIGAVMLVAAAYIATTQRQRL